MTGSAYSLRCRVYLLSIEESDMRNGCGKSTKTESIDESKHNAKVKLAIAFVSGKIDIKRFLVKDPSDVEMLTGVIKCLRGIERELLRLIGVAPVEDRKDNIEVDDETAKEICYSEERHC